MKTIVLMSILVLSVGCTGRSGAQSTDPAQVILESLHPPPKAAKAPKSLRLLPGYKHARSVDFEGNTVGKISKAGGLTFDYSYSPFPEPDVDVQDQYRGFSEETINGHRVRRGFRFGRYELDIDLCRVQEYSHVVSFSANVRSPSEAADMITMALTVLDSDLKRSDGCIAMD